MPVPTEILTDCSRFVCCIFHFFAIFAVKLNNRRRMKAERISFWENVQEASCELALWNSERAGQIVNAVADRAEEEIPSLLEMVLILSATAGMAYIKDNAATMYNLI